jgi:protein-tyrosine-phosphatase
MAEGWAKKLGADVIDAWSAGTEKYHEVKPKAVLVMEEAGVDMSSHRPKLLEEIPERVDILVSMGCGVKCPFILHDFMEDWEIEDPSGGTVDDFRETRDILKQRVAELIGKIKSGYYDKKLI